MTYTLTDIITIEPQCLIGYTLGGEPILDMSRAQRIRPGEWGHIASRSAQRIRSGWTVNPSKFRHPDDREEGPNQ